MAAKIRLKDIAKKLGVSAATVSLALNHPQAISRERRREILELCRNLGYYHRRYKKGIRKNIGVLSSSFHIALGGFYNFVTIGILKHAKKLGLDTVLGTYEDDADTVPTLVTKRIVDGIVIVGRFPRDFVLQLQQEGLPMVLCGNPIPGVELHTVMPDGRAGIYLMTKHLIELGHRQIATITGGPIFDPITSDRLDGYRFALTEGGLPVREEFIAIGDFYDVPSATEPAVDKILNLAVPPTAIVCACDAIAYKVIQILKTRGIRVPKDFSVTGFDDEPFPEFLQESIPKLTTAHVPLEQLGETGVEILLDVIQNPAKAAYRHTIPIRLVTRETTAEPRK